MGIGEKRDTTADLGGENLGLARFVVYSEDSTWKFILSQDVYVLS